MREAFPTWLVRIRLLCATILFVHLAGSDTRKVFFKVFIAGRFLSGGSAFVHLRGQSTGAAPQLPMFIQCLSILLVFRRSYLMPQWHTQRPVANSTFFTDILYKGSKSWTRFRVHRVPWIAAEEFCTLIVTFLVVTELLHPLAAAKEMKSS